MPSRHRIWIRTLSVTTKQWQTSIREIWIADTKNEIGSLKDHGTWTEANLLEAITSKILPCQWVFRRKRTPDGNVKSHKARMVARGDLEQGVFQTFAPVVAWSTVRLSWSRRSFSIGILARSISAAPSFRLYLRRSQCGFMSLVASNPQEEVAAAERLRWSDSKGTSMSEISSDTMV